MYLLRWTTITAVATFFSSPAWAGEGHCANELAVDSSYVKANLGIVISKKPGIVDSFTCSANGLSGYVVVSSDLDKLGSAPLNNPGSEVDVGGSLTKGPLTVTVEYDAYPYDGNGSGKKGDVYGALTLEGPYGFSFGIEEFAGHSDITALGITSPALRIQDASLTLGFWHVITPRDEYQTLTAGATIPLGAQAFAAVDVFASSKHDAGAAIKVGWKF